MLDTSYKYRVMNIVLAGTEADMEYQLHGEMIFFHSSLNNTTIRVRLHDQGNDLIPLSVKQQITAPFEKFFLTASGADTITLFITNPKEIKFEGLSASVDTLNNQIQDNSFRYYSDQQKSFIGGIMWTAAGSTYGEIELFNQTGSGKKVYVNSIVPMVGYAGSYLYALIVSTQLTSPTAISKQAKYAGGAASAITLQRKDDASAPSITSAFWQGWAHETTYGAFLSAFPNILHKEPLVLPEGYGVRIVTLGTALQLGAIFEWLEI